MSLPIEFLSGANADLQQIFNQFEDYREGFGTEFMLAVDAYLARIGTFPEIAPRYFENVRRQVMQDFPAAFSIRSCQRAYLSRLFSIYGRIPKKFVNGYGIRNPPASQSNTPCSSGSNPLFSL